MLIVAPSPSTFVVRDLKLLSPDREASFVRNPMQKDLKAVLGLPRFLFSTLRSDLIITWFADASKFPVRMAKLFHKKVIVVIGGYDVAKVESIGYGALLDPKKKRKEEYALQRADAVVAVDQGLVDDLVKHFNRDFDAEVVPTGYDDSVYQPSGNKKALVLSVCNVIDRRGLVKGIDVFAECARRMPDVPFRLIGVSGGALETLGVIPKNLEVLGKLPAEEVIKHYQEAKVYCQLSMREGLPNAVCEAMLCGCIPVGSDVQGVRTAIGEHGSLVPYGDVEAACKAIRNALSTEDLGGREWIISEFPERKRKERLNELLDRLLGRPGQ